MGIKNSIRQRGCLKMSNEWKRIISCYVYILFRYAKTNNKNLIKFQLIYYNIYSKQFCNSDFNMYLKFWTFIWTKFTKK